MTPKNWYDEELVRNKDFVPPIEKQTFPIYLAELVQGLYKDYNAFWFKDIGTLVQKPFIVIVFLPIIQFVCLYVWRLGWRMYDQGRCKWPE